MKLTLRLRDDILALTVLVQDIKARDNQVWSDSAISKLCFNHGEFVHDLRKWDGGKKSASLQKIGEFESFLRDQITPKQYDEFRASRAAISK